MALSAGNCKLSDQSSTEQPAESVDSNQSEEVIPMFLVAVENLRFRSQPNLTAPILGLLKEGDTLISLNDSTDFREKIMLRDIEYFAPWYKVRSETMDTVGWVYGGAIISSTVMSGNIVLKPGRMVFKLEQARGDNLQVVLQIPDLDPSGTYDGYYEYRLSQGDQRVLDGSFRISQQHLIEEYNQYAEISYEGRFREGKKDGAFLRRTSFPESNSTATLYYEAKINDCIWGSISAQAEGEQYNYREDNPDHCSFDYLREKAGLQKLKITE